MSETKESSPELLAQEAARARSVELVSTAFSICVTHQAVDHDDGRAWSDCRFRQLFYFENPMDEHTMLWSDEIDADRHTETPQDDLDESLAAEMCADGEHGPWCEGAHE